MLHWQNDSSVRADEYLLSTGGGLLALNGLPVDLSLT